jgi:hypothetical protein
MNADLRGYEEVSSQQPQYAEALRTQLASFLSLNSRLSFGPHLPYDETCTQFRLQQWGESTSGGLLVIPHQLPVPDVKISLTLDRLAEVESVLDNVLMGNRRRVEARVGLERPLLLRLRPPSEEEGDLARGRPQRSSVDEFLKDLEAKQRAELDLAAQHALNLAQKQDAAASAKVRQMTGGAKKSAGNKSKGKQKRRRR